MKIAIAQLNYTIGDVDGNASKIIDSINKAKAQRADLVIFAEQAVSGTPAFDLLRKTTFLELCEDALVEIASCCDGIAAIVGLPILTNNGTISAAALIQDRKVLRYVGKKYITARREMGFLVPSKGFEYATIKGHKCAIIVGDDLSREHDFDKSVETVISINARKYGKGTMTYRYDMMRHLSFVEAKNLVLVNQVGGATDIVYDGTSGAFNNRGELVLMMKQFEEDFQIFDTKAQNPPVGVPSTYNDRTRMVYQAARCGLRDFFLKNGYKKACIGLSGGIDSAVVACLAADALGWKKSTTYTVLKKLCERGVLQNADGQVTSLIKNEDVQQAESAAVVDKTFGGSLPRFVAAFLNTQPISDAEAAEIRALLDAAHREEG